MRIYYSQQSLIYKGFNRYWCENDVFHKYYFYRDIKRFKHENPIEFKNRSKYNILEDKKPLCYYGKQDISIPRKFLFTLKRLNSRAYRGTIRKIQYNIVIEYAYMRKKICTDYYLSIYDLGK